MCDLVDGRVSDRCKDCLGYCFFDCLFLSLEKIGVVIIEVRFLFFSDRGRLLRYFSVKVG